MLMMMMVMLILYSPIHVYNILLPVVLSIKSIIEVHLQLDFTSTSTLQDIKQHGRRYSNRIIIMVVIPRLAAQQATSFPP
jgi:hypothetical protein